MATATKEPRTVVHKVRIREELIPRLKRAAAKDHRSVTSWVSKLIEEALSNGTRR